MRHFWKKYHKWVGLFFTFFILMFCLSGIVLNHRPYFSKCEVSRGWMPSAYEYNNWNNGMVRGTVRLPSGELLAYGSAGIWKTDSCLSFFAPFSQGLREGADHHQIRDIAVLSDGSVWCAALYDLYRLSPEGRWILCTPKDTRGERLADVTAKGDTLVLLTRSYVFEAAAPYQQFIRYELAAPEGYEPETSLFRTVWVLHSGELFGTPGKLLVDLVALVLVVLCVTGLFYLFLPKSMRHRSRLHLPVKREARWLKFTVRWHNQVGAWTLFFTVLLAATGMCLRPPLMVPLVLTSVPPLPGTTLDDDNPWHDHLRAARWDEARRQWLISTSSGFYQLRQWDEVPQSFEKEAPVSPMGISVFEKNRQGEWLIGSFSGLFRWNIDEGKVVDYFTGKPYQPTFGPPIADHALAGFSQHFVPDTEVLFDYQKGAGTRTDDRLNWAQQSEKLADLPMSLWNFALEVHVGRCYQPFLGPVSVLFVFLSGLLLTLLLISGHILHRKPKHKKVVQRGKTAEPQE